ncbi:group I intron-associated PD-(D/E)XK endonuclease [Streptomyces mirabilis]|uniref:group I intron-associated PD-(D/E)XK endonuclease n=1 Tax=Streptomyces mirabilis TaxID=68239 RepID=UPI0036B57715
MAITNYRRGADFERAVRADLVEHGYEVIRSAGSKTKVDLVAIKTGELLLIQCKLAAGRLPSGEWNRLRALSRMCDARPVVARKVDGVVQPYYMELLADAPEGRKRDAGVCWQPWSPDPLGER